MSSSPTSTTPRAEEPCPPSSSPRPDGSRFPRSPSCGRPARCCTGSGPGTSPSATARRLLGVVWVVLQPLLTALVFVLVFGQGRPPLLSEASRRSCSSSSGLLAWNLFSGIIPRAQGSLVSNRDLVSKVFFPRMLVPLAVVYSCLIDFLVSTAFLIVLLVIFGVDPGFAVLLSPGVDPPGDSPGQRHRHGDRRPSPCAIETSTTSSRSCCSSCSTPAPSPTRSPTFPPSTGSSTT